MVFVRVVAQLPDGSPESISNTGSFIQRPKERERVLPNWERSQYITGKACKTTSFSTGLTSREPLQAFARDARRPISDICIHSLWIKLWINI